MRRNSSAAITSRQRRAATSAAAVAAATAATAAAAAAERPSGTNAGLANAAGAGPAPMRCSLSSTQELGSSASFTAALPSAPTVKAHAVRNARKSAPAPVAQHKVGVKPFALTCG